VCRTVSSCFAALRQLHSIRRLVSATVSQSLVTALVNVDAITIVDSTMVMAWSASKPTLSNVHRLQSVQYAAARLVFRLRRSDHITDALASLRWLQVPERIICKIAVHTYRALCGDAPQYLWQLTSIADIPSRQNKACGILYPTIHSFLPALTYRTAYPADVTSASSLVSFRKRLKLHSVSTSPNQDVAARCAATA